MAEDLSIKVKIEADGSDVPHQLNTLENSLAPIRVDVSLDNLGDVRGQIANLGKDKVDVTINPVIGNGGVKNAVQNNLGGKKIDLDILDTSKVFKDLQALNTQLTKLTTNITTALNTKVKVSMDATASNVKNLGNSFGVIQKKIDTITNSADKSKMQNELNAAKTTYNQLLQTGTVSTEQFSNMAERIGGVNKAVQAVIASEKQLATQTKSLDSLRFRGIELIDSYNRNNNDLESSYNNASRKYLSNDDKNARRRLLRQQTNISGVISDYQDAIKAGDYSAAQESYNNMAHLMKMYQRNSKDLQDSLNAEKTSWEQNAKAQAQAAAQAKKTQEQAKKQATQELTKRKTQASRLDQQYQLSDFGDAIIKYSAAKTNRYTTADMDKYYNATDRENTRFKNSLGAFNNDPTEKNLQKLIKAYNSYIVVRKRLSEILSEEKSKWEKSVAGIESAGKKLDKTYSGLEQQKTKLETTYAQKVKGTNFTNSDIEDLVNGTNGIKSISALQQEVEANKKTFEKTGTRSDLQAYENSVEALTQALAKLGGELAIAAKKSDSFMSSMTGKRNKYGSDMNSLVQNKNDLEALATSTGNMSMLATGLPQGQTWGKVTTAYKDADDAMKTFNADMTSANLQTYEQALTHLKEALSQFRSELTKTIAANGKFEDSKAANSVLMNQYINDVVNARNHYQNATNSGTTSLLSGVDTQRMNQALIDANNAQSAFEKNMNPQTLEVYRLAMSALVTEIKDLNKALDSADKESEAAFNSLPTQITRVESTLNTLRTTYREQQNRGNSDVNVEATINTYEKVLERMRAIEASGSTDYNQFIQMFADFDQKLSESGIHINTFTDFMQAMVSVATQAKATISDLGNAFKQQQNIESLNKRLSNMLYTLERYIEINKKIQGNSDMMAEYQGIKDTIQTALRNTDRGFKETQLSEAAEAVAKFKTEVQGLGLEGKTVSQIFQNLFGQHFSTMIAMGALHTMQNSLQFIYQNVLEIDSAMTELKKVTDETSATYANFLSEAGERAKELGASISDVVSATADFARLGYNLQDATKIADSAILFKQVGDGVQDIDEASADIISAMKAFNIEAENSVQITDKFNEVGNSYAITSAGTAEALQRSAAALAAAGNNIDQSIGMIVAANDVAQSPEQVGNALKVLSLRIRGASAELEAMGEDADGTAISTAKLQSEIKALSGVDIMKDKDTFKSTFEILDELADKWGSLSDISRASILEDLAGKNRASVVAGMLENWDDAKAAMETARDSAGSANKELNTYLNSAEGKITQFQATFQSLSQDVLDSDIVKNVIDFGTAALNAADGFVKWSGAIPAVVSGLSAFLSLSNTKTQGNIQMFAYAGGIAA